MAASRPNAQRNALVLSTVLFVSLVCLGIAALETFHTLGERKQTLHEVYANTANLAQAVIQNAEDTIEIADTVLVGLVERLEADGTSAEALARLDRYLGEKGMSLPQLSGFRVYDEDGFWIASSRSVMPVGIRNTERSYFAYHRSNADRRAFIGPPVRSRSGEEPWIITITRRFNHTDGRFAGVVLARIDSHQFARWYGTLEVGKRGAITLIHDDGAVLSRHPFDPEFIGRKLIDAGRMRLTGEGMSVSASPIDGVERFVAYQASAKYPLIGLAAVAKNEAMYEWRAGMWWRLATITILVAIVGALGFLLVSRLHDARLLEMETVENEMKFRMLADHSSDMVTHVGPNGIYRYVSPASERLLGWKPEELVGRSALDAIHPDDHPAAAAMVERLRSGQSEEVSTVYRMCRKDGTETWVEATIRVLRDEDNRAAGGVVAIARDVRDRRMLEQQLELRATTDGLTGVANRRIFEERLLAEWRRAARDRIPVSLLLLDIDHFKAFNDTYGHPAGDECLRTVAATVERSIRRPGDLAARYGGEEFAVILPHTDETGAAVIGERIRTAVEALALPHSHPPAGGRVSISVGAATAYPEADPTGQTTARLVAAADSALYAAKRAGRNRVQAWSPPQAGHVAADSVV